MEKINIDLNSPIGIFDSGLGGLTVLKSLVNILPNESFIYFGDTAHLPYGNKSVDTITKYSKNILDFFNHNQTKAVVIACNTASSLTYNILQKTYTVPLFDVVSPSVEFSIQQSQTKKIGVIGTTNTVNSKAYSNYFNKENKNFIVFEKDCPLFVPIIEEGWANTQIAEQVAQKYLDVFKNKNIDTLILGCTHYPIMEKTIKRVLNPNIKLVFSGETVGNKLLSYLNNNKLCAESNKKPTIKFYVSDFPQKFEKLGRQFFGEKLNDVKSISFD